MTKNIEQRTEAAVKKYEGAAGIAHEFANSENEHTTAEPKRRTLKGFEVLANDVISDAVANTIDKNYLGDWQQGSTTFNSFNDYAVFNGQSYKPKNKSGITFPYVAQGSDPTQLPDSDFVQPFSDINSDNFGMGEVLSLGSLIKRTLAERHADIFNIKDWLLGDGIDDGTARLQAMLDSTSGDIAIGVMPGTFVVNNLSLGANRKVIFLGFGGKLISNVKSTTMFTADQSVDLGLIRVEVDGKNKLQGLAKAAGNLFVTDCDIYNLWSENLAGVAVNVDYSLSDKKYAKIYNNRIHDIHGIESGLIGASAGATRAIIAQLPSDVAKSSQIEIHDNYFNNIFGREGDIIHCFDSMPDNPVLSRSRTVIRNNHLGLSNRRSIKVQGNHVHVTDNFFRTINGDHEKYGLDGDGGAGVAAFGTNAGQTSNVGCKFNRNTVENNGGIKGYVYFWEHHNGEVVGNTLYYGDTGEAAMHPGCITVNGGSNIKFMSNIVDGSCQMSLSNAGPDCVVKDNEFRVSVDGVRSMLDNIEDLGDRLQFINNAIYVDDVTRDEFLGVVLPAGNTSLLLDDVMFMGNRLISNPEYVGRKPTLMYFNGDETTVVSGMYFHRNFCNHGDMFLGYSDVNVEESEFVDNYDGNGLIKKVPILGENLCPNSYFKDGVGSWSNAVWAENEQGLKVAIGSSPYVTIPGLVNGKRYAISVKGRNFNKDNTSWSNLILGNETKPLEMDETTTYFTYDDSVNAGILQISPHNSLANGAIHSIEVREVLRL